MSLESMLQGYRQQNHNLEQRLEELAEELADVEQENDALENGLKKMKEYSLELEKENQQLTQQLQTTGNFAQPDSLESRLQSCHEEKHNLQVFVEQAMEELQKELANAKQINATLLENLKSKEECIQELEKTIWLLRQQLQTAGASVEPDYEGIRDRTLNKLKVGKQSTAGKAIDVFVKEIMHK